MPKMFTKDVYVKPFSGPLCDFLLLKDIVHYAFAKYTCSKTHHYVNELATLLLVFYCNSNVREPVLTIIN